MSLGKCSGQEVTGQEPIAAARKEGDMDKLK